MSVKDKFCTQNLLLISSPPILGRSDDKFSLRKLASVWKHGHPCPFCNFKARAKINTPDASVGYRAQRFARYVLIRWLQSALIPFVTTQSVAEDGGYSTLRTNKAETYFLYVEYFQKWHGCHWFNQKRYFGKAEIRH